MERNSGPAVAPNGLRRHCDARPRLSAASCLPADSWPLVCGAKVTSHAVNTPSMGSTGKSPMIFDPRRVMSVLLQEVVRHVTMLTVDHKTQPRDK
jgi:hypothetical protein